MSIFGGFAQFYWNAGLQAIPLHKNEKRPVINGWQVYGEKESTKEEREGWLAQYDENNIGLALGKMSNVMMIDIDTDDPKLIAAIKSVLPHSPWERKGKKGLMLAYKYIPIRTFRIKNVSGEMFVEGLTTGTQCVLPYSIHPDTRRPYTSNTHLWEVLDKLNFLPEDVEEKLRAVLEANGIQLSTAGWSKVTEFVSAGSRDTKMTEMAGLFALAVVRGERTLKQAIGMLSSFYEEFVENVAGDSIDVQKHIQNLVKFLHRDIVERQKILPKGWDDGYTPEELVALGVTISSEHVEWTYEEGRDFLFEQFQLAVDASDPGATKSQIVNEALVKLARSKNMNKLDEDRILKYILDQSGMGLQMSTLKSRLKEIKQGKVKGNDHSELARAMIADLEEFFPVRGYTDELYKFNGSNWEPIEKNEVKAKLSETFGHMDACKRASDINQIYNLMKIIIKQGIADEPIKGVNFANGFLTEELKLVDHNPDFGMTYTLPFRYMPEVAGKFPNFQKFMETAWGKDEDFRAKVDALQEAIAVTIFGVGYKYQRAVLLHGAPKTGKTQLLRIIESLVPFEAKCTIPPEDWSDDFKVSHMRNRILNICGELSERKLIDGQKFKDIIDGSPLSTRQIYGQLFQMMPMLTHWFASNHMPRSSDTSSGFIRRWLVLSFQHPIKPEDRQIDIGLKIVAEEREAIVAWAVEAIPRLLKKNEFTLPKSHYQVCGEVANINNSVRFFLTEAGKVELVAGGGVEEDKIYNAYWAFCLGPGATQPVKRVRFKAMMRELAVEFGFNVEIHPAAFGSSITHYNGIQMVGEGKRGLKVVN